MIDLTVEQTKEIKDFTYVSHSFKIDNCICEIVASVAKQKQVALINEQEREANRNQSIK